MSPPPPAVLPWAVAAGVVAVHVLIACLYAATLWLSLVAYLLIVGGPWHLALVFAPLLISGGAIALLVLDLTLLGIRWLWRSRGTWRWWPLER